jgi:hypothetical protein
LVIPQFTSLEKSHLLDIGDKVRKISLKKQKSC